MASRWVPGAGRASRADERYVVERFEAHADGDIRPWPGEEPAKGKGRRAKRVTATSKTVKEMCRMELKRRSTD